MEEAPKPTLQDELEWCISQLETGLLRLNPTPQQAEESRRILGVLRSRQAPLAKKRQVMDRVFGNYRLKMAEERERAANAAMKLEEVQIQPGDHSGGVAYRKQSGPPSEASASWFVPSENDFQFDFALSEGESRENADGTAGAQELGSAYSQSDGHNPSGRLVFPSGNQGSEFAFNFATPEAPPLPPDPRAPGSEAAAEVEDARETPVMAPEEAPVLGSETPSVVGDAHTIHGDCSVREAPAQPPTQVGLEGAPEAEPSTAAAGTSCKKKRRKKQRPVAASHGGSVNGGSKSKDKDTADQTEASQSDEQLKKEVDWCVEQLELGLKTRKATPKQRDEALRTIRILRSEKTVLAKKRQLMRAQFGDYRTKMAEERQKQLKLMQAASKAARIAEVTQRNCRKKSQVFRRSTERAQQVKSPAENTHQSSVSSSPDPGTSDPSPFRFIASQGEFHFNFF